MLSWLVRFPKETLDKEMARDLARADDDGFALAANNSGSQSTD